MKIFLALGSLAAGGSWGPYLRQYLRHVPQAAGGFLDPKTAPPISSFWLRDCASSTAFLGFRLGRIYGSTLNIRNVALHQESPYSVEKINIHRYIFSTALRPVAASCTAIKHEKITTQISLYVYQDWILWGMCV